MEPIKTIKRKRPFLSKTRTGCLTCKVRKVKCDEEKPACRRCTSTGRKCDGYAPVSKSASTTPPSRHSSPGKGPSTDLFATNAERRSFSYFETRACHDLGGSFHWQFWAREILQAAVHYPSTRHLVVAIGAAYEGYQGKAGEGSASSQDALRLSFEQSNQSIQLMGALFAAASTERQSTETTCNILASSVLFAYLACLQGQVGQAIKHVRSGLKVLQSFEKTKLIEDPTSAFPVSISHLRSLLTSIYGQIRCMINDEARATWEHDPIVSLIAPVLSYATIAEAHNYVESLWHNLLAFLQYTELHPPTTSDEIARFTAQHHLLSQALESSQQALELLASRRSPSHDDQDEPGFNILRLYHTLITIRLRVNPLDPGNREAAFDSLEQELAQMLQYCELIVNSQQSKTGPSFSSGLGYVMPLHTIAARCRNPRIRRRALQLLMSSGRREGLWDALLTGKIVTTTMEREERLASLQTIPSDARIREVKIEFLDERKARIRYITVADWRARLYGEQHILEW
ncbi:hypothetical protein H2200_006633 [Cladophialophora chaetospira]|uniref:Zn(2)-C6 fungal-type domain-containing protein n=1 Tax=Cladophialophora chaetospira TaxID=386627 RepID=A0AA39CHE0_9EURO|nr:hypothetical protein H2200_006633 [Cladophialophora chaetospira]